MLPERKTAQAKLMPHLWIWMVLAVFCFLMIPLWLLVIAGPLKAIPTNFTYSADILSLDNIYDPTLKKFEGPQISRTTFKYKIIATNSHYFTVENVFAVQKQSGAPIFSVKRLYYINPYTGEHVTNVPDMLPKREGYLFAPRYLDKSDFYYWHVNYNSQADMKFVGTQKVDGLNVYHYEASYTVDQTENLKNLPGVPEKRGIITHTTLQLWVEPISGWLVKYQDNSLASYYDKQTGKITEPWNMFSNRYTKNSIRDQVEKATELKWEFLAIDFGVPGVLIILSLVFLTIAYKKTVNPDYQIFSKPTRSFVTDYLGPNLIWGLILFALMITGYNFFSYKKTSHTYTVGISEWNITPDLQEAVKGFKDRMASYGYREGKNIRYITKTPQASVERQIDIIQDFVDQNVDVIFTMSTPGTLVAKGITTTTPIVFADVAYPEESSIINNPPNKNSNVIGSRDYMAPPWQFYMFVRMSPNTKVLGFVHRKGGVDSDALFHEFNTMLARQGISVIDMAAIDLDDIRQLLQSKQYDSLYLACDTLMQQGGEDIVIQYAREHKIPTLSCNKESVVKGALMGYISDQYTVGRLAGRKAALILGGADPSWLRVETPVHGFLIINLDTAELLNIKVPPELVQRADQIVQSKPKQDKPDRDKQQVKKNEN